MNIYNDTQGAQSSYPTNPIFNSVQITNSLTLNGLSKGDLLFVQDNTNDVAGLAVGDQDMVLTSDKNNSGIPEWKDTLKLNVVELNDLKITGLVQGDILCGGATVPFISRLPVGADNQILYSNGTEIGWQSKNVGKHAFYYAGSANNISSVLAPSVGGNGFSLTSGRLYKMTVSAQIDSAVETVHQLWLNSLQVPELFFLYDGNADMAKTFLYTSPIDGALFIELRSAAASGTASIYDFRMFAEEY